MSVHAGQIIHVGGNNVIDRIQNAGLGDVKIPIETIREVGNREIVDKIPGDPDFTFTLESWDCSTELEAWLAGGIGAGTGSAQAPGQSDPDGTEYKWEDCGFLNIPSPWKDELTGSAGVVEAGHLVPAYYPNRIRYRYGVTDQASEEVELAGGSFYYSAHAPFEQFETGDNSTVTFPTDFPAIGHRLGGAEGSSFKRIFGVLVDGEIMVEGVDYNESGGAVSAASDSLDVVFTVAPRTGADIRFAYFTDTAQAYPQAVHASTVTKPGAVRGRNIVVYLGSGGTRTKLGSVQAFELEATVEGDVEREFGNIEIVGRQINGRDCNGSVTVRSKNPDAFFTLLAKVTGIPEGEVIGWLNQNDIPLEVAIQNPKNPAQIIKTLYVKDAIFTVPGTPAKVNTPTDFELKWESQSGTHSVYKGAKPA